MIAQSGKLEYQVVWLHCDSPTWEINLNGDTSVLELVPVVILQYKGFSMRSVLTHLNRNRLKNCWIAVERSEMAFISIHIISNQNPCHDDKSVKQRLTRVFCPQLIRNVRTRRRIESSSIIANPVNFALHLYTGGRCRWKYETKISICVYIHISI